MEAIIFAIITLIISAFAKRKNANDEDGKTKPFMAKPLDQQPMRKIEDYAKEIVGDVQKQFTERQAQPKPKPAHTVRKQAETIMLANEAVKETIKAPQSSGRLSAHQPTMKRLKTEDDITIVPATEKDLLQAIIFSEILSPPKSRR